ncbi:MAG: hypothetical protein ACUVUP_01960 [Thermaceae bacterium]
MWGRKKALWPRLWRSSFPFTQGAKTLVLSAEPEVLDLAQVPLRIPVRLAPELDPILLVRALYPLVAALGRARGVDVDRPPLLRKVTRTF